MGDGAEGEWAESLLPQRSLAPHLMPVEVTSYLRQGVLAGALEADVASLALDDLDGLPVTLHPFHPLGDRVWELRSTVTAYDGWYVDLAEALDQPLATLDARLVASPGPRCAFVTPDDS